MACSVPNKKERSLLILEVSSEFLRCLGTLSRVRYQRPQISHREVDIWQVSGVLYSRQLFQAVLIEEGGAIWVTGFPGRVLCTLSSMGPLCLLWGVVRVAWTNVCHPATHRLYGISVSESWRKTNTLAGKKSGKKQKSPFHRENNLCMVLLDKLNDRIHWSFVLKIKILCVP